MAHDETASNRIGFRTRVKTGTGFPYPILRSIYRSIYAINVPVPRFLCVALWQMVTRGSAVYYWAKSVFLVSPMYRGLCRSIGKNFRAGTFVPYVEGRGNIYLGDNVRYYGKQTYVFASIRNEPPTIQVGDNSGFGHNVLFDIAGKLSVGKGCLVASNVTFVDCGGHSIVPALREQGTPPTESDVRDITIGDNVWIGPGAYILPGATIGDNCVIAPNTSVTRNIPANSLVYSVAPKVMAIRDISSII